MQAGTHSAILCKSDNGRHTYVCVATPTHVAHGRKTLQMHGFPIGVNQKSHQISSFDPFCVPI